MRLRTPLPRRKNQTNGAFIGENQSMTNGETGAGLLSPYRVLDLAYDNGILAGKILADLGADVIAIEPPEGSPVRRLPPFYRDKPGTEHSLVWWAYAAGKRSAVLDLKSEPGRERLLSLAKTADFLLESFPPGYLDELGLGFNALHDLSPRLVVVSMTPFGQDGPYSRYEAPDIVGAALGGFMNLTGDSDRPPLRVSELQFPSHLGTAGAAGAMIAHHHRLLTGRGQHVDVSGQQAIARALAHAPAFWSLLSTNIQRYGTRRERAGGLKSRTLWPCKDGYVTYALQGGPMGASTNALARWVDEEGFGDDFLRSLDWTEVDFNDDVQDTVDRGCWTAGAVLRRPHQDRAVLRVGRAAGRFVPRQHAVGCVYQSTAGGPRILHEDRAPGSGSVLRLPRRVRAIHGSCLGSTISGAAPRRAHSRSAGLVAHGDFSLW